MITVWPNLKNMEKKLWTKPKKKFIFIEWDKEYGFN